MSLLNDMNQFMREQLSAIGSFRPILVRVNNHMFAHRERGRAYQVCRGAGARLAVNAHPTEVIAESRFRRAPRSKIEWMTGRRDDLVNKWRSEPRVGRLTRSGRPLKETEARLRSMPHRSPLLQRKIMHRYDDTPEVTDHKEPSSSYRPMSPARLQEFSP